MKYSHPGLHLNKISFCQQLSYRKKKKLIKVSTFEYDESLQKKVNETGDTQLKLHVGDFSKLVANDAVHYKGCHANSMSPKQKLEKNCLHMT